VRSPPPRDSPSHPLQTILIIKTGALGDVLRTTSILPGLKVLNPGTRIEWITAPLARDLVVAHPDVDRTHLLDTSSLLELEKLAAELDQIAWDWVISLDDEEPLCALATRLGKARLSGAYHDAGGERVYSEDVAPWFDMGLLSVHGKQVADRMKVENKRSHPEIYAQMLGIEMGRPLLPLQEAGVLHAERLFKPLDKGTLVVGLNTGAGGRWTSKQLPTERTIELALEMNRTMGGPLAFVVLGGPDEIERNADIVRGLRAADGGPLVLDVGVNNSLPEFAAIVSRLDLLITSDSLALHISVACNVPIVAFFAPTSAAEIELYGLGEKVLSQSPDYCSYRPDADNSTLSTERLLDAVTRVCADHTN
jgi:heptosyltransferase-2